jgi:hypothetical protein
MPKSDQDIYANDPVMKQRSIEDAVTEQTKSPGRVNTKGQRDKDKSGQ